jgi:arylsulfatase A-like enzyme
MRRLEEEGLSSNTLVVFTTDHASFVDDDYILSFYPAYERADTFCDRIPLVFYYEGITPGVVDADGRNSLDLAPTVLDYLDIDSPNYFLGSSLFLPVQNELVETVFCVPDSEWMVSTADGELRDLTEEEAEEFRTYLESYLSLTRRTENPIY